MPNKKHPRQRNRPRNKANRLKLLENQNHNVKEIQNELNDLKSKDEEDILKNVDDNLTISDRDDDNDEYDDDMPGLMEETPSGDLNHNNKTMQTIKDHPQEQEDPLKNFEKIMQSKFLQKKSKTSSSSSTTGTKNSDAKAKPTGKTKEKVKDSQNIVNTSEEKNAFIQNLQKKMEAMMANGDENLPNTLMENLQKMFDQGPITDIETSDDEEEYIEYIYKPRKYFLVALCNLCKIDLCKVSPLIECSKCHMTYYCSMEHMQNDAEHQQLCYALQQVANESCDGHIFKNCSTMAADNFRSYRIVTIRKIESVLKRPLTATEQEVILFPRLCNRTQCREYRFDKLHDCSECGMISYCLEHPEHLSPEEHAKWCKSYQIFKELVQFQDKFGRLEPTLPTKILKEIPMTCLNTKEVFKKLGLDLPENAEYASLTQISTGPLTAWYALKLSDQLKNHESLTIHLIGAEIEFEVDVLHKWELFFLHITPSVKYLNIVFVGPELNPHNISFEQLQKTKCCVACRKANRYVRYYFESYIYHDYCGSHKFLTPNLICFFNAGLYRSTGYNMEDTWPDTILAASNLQVPIVVTAYTEYESPLDMARFSEECQRKLRLILAPSENPFASVKPERNFISDDEASLMFKNYYCFVVSGDDAQNVVQRQEKVMQQLNELKAQLAGIRSTLGLCAKGPQHTTSFITNNNGGLREIQPLQDVVINGHPNFIPYCLLALKNAWQDLFAIDVKTFTHSTMNDIGKDAKAFEEALKAVPVKENLPKINITLIWKNCEHTEMISSPTMYVPIYGEVNIIRYLGRVGPIQYRYEDSPLCNEIDAVLDICYQLLRCTTPKSKVNMLRILSNRLQKQQYFGGDHMSIADIGVHSSLKRMPSISEKDLTPTLTEWLRRAEKYTLI